MLRSCLARGCLAERLEIGLLSMKSDNLVELWWEAIHSEDAVESAFDTGCRVTRDIERE